MISILILTVWKLILPIVFVFALIDILTQTQPQRIRRLKKSGMSQLSIANKLGITRYKVRLALA
jgi:hypothetical protein